MHTRTISLAGRLASPRVAKRKASILIISLWTILILTTFAIILGYGVRARVTLAVRLEQRDRARYLNQANIRMAIMKIKKQGADSFVVLRGAPWSYIYEQSEVELESNAGFIENQYAIFDEAGKININNARSDVLERFFKLMFNLEEIEAQELAACIIDWRDKDSMYLLPVGSAEDSDYRNLRFSYEAKDEDFDCLAELLLVQGVTAEIFQNLKDYLTIYGDGRVNINTASQPVLLALGLSEYLVDNIIAFRDGKDKKEDTADDVFFNSASDISAQLGNFCVLSKFQQDELDTISASHLTIGSDYFMIKSRIKFGKRQNRSQLTVIVNRAGNILSWEEF